MGKGSMSRNKVHYNAGHPRGIDFAAACREWKVRPENLTTDPDKITCGPCWRDIGMGKIKGVKATIIRD